MFAGLTRVALLTSVAAPAVVSTTWDPATSSASWALSGGNLTATTSSVTGTVDLFGTTAKSSGNFSVTVTASGQIFIGLTPTIYNPATTDPGSATGPVTYDRSNGLFWKNGGAFTPSGGSAVTYTTGDVINVSYDGANVTFKKNGATVGSTSMTGAAYPIASTTGSSTVLVGDFSGW